MVKKIFQIMQPTWLCKMHASELDLLAEWQFPMPIPFNERVMGLVPQHGMDELVIIYLAVLRLLVSL